MGLIAVVAASVGNTAALYVSFAVIALGAGICFMKTRRSSSFVGAIQESLSLRDVDGEDPDSILLGIRSHIDSLRSDASSQRQEAAFLRRILAAMSEAVLVLDASNRTMFANEAASLLLGTEPVVPTQALGQGPFEFTVRRPDQRTLRATSSALEEGGWLVVIQDVTEARRLDAVRRDFVSNVSHELKTPVAGILASAETLEVTMRENPGAAQGFMRSLLRETRRLSGMVEDLLDLARLEQEPQGFEDVDLTTLVAAEVDKARALADAKGLPLDSELEPGVRVVGASVDLALAVRNLLVNAIQYTEGGRVSIRLSRRSGAATIEVADTGVGIPAKDLPRIFERFYRVDKARSRETGGTGLGLSIVRHVAEQHSGEVRAVSELQGGSTFTLSIPTSRGAQ